MGKRSSRRLSSDDDSDDDDRRLWNGETEKNDYRALEGARDLWYGYNDYYDYAEKDEKEIPMPKSGEGARLLDDDDDWEYDEDDEDDDRRLLWDEGHGGDGDYRHGGDHGWDHGHDHGWGHGHDNGWGHGHDNGWGHGHGHSWAEKQEQEKPQATQMVEQPRGGPIYVIEQPKRPIQAIAPGPV